MNSTQSVLKWLADAEIREQDKEEMLKIIEDKLGQKVKVKDPAEKFTLKQQILLLEALGILDSKEIKALSDSKKAELFSNLLNRSEKTVKDHLTYLNKKNPPIDFFCRKEDNEKKVNELLKSTGISEIKKK